MLTFGSLFAGIGGFDLGFERAGMECRWQVEIDDYCNQVLAKHWSDVKRYRDVREIHGAFSHAEPTRTRYKAKKIGGQTRESLDTGAASIRQEHGQASSSGINSDGTTGFIQSCPSCLESVDVICGGFPCPPFSVAGKRRGAADDRNLWPEFKRIIAEVRPRWVVAENVLGLRTLYLDTVLSDLEGLEYTCETVIIPAVAFDAPHRRDRLWIVAYTEGKQTGHERQDRGSGSRKVDAFDHTGRAGRGNDRPEYRAALADTESKGLQNEISHTGNSKAAIARLEQIDRWFVKPRLGRVDDGIPCGIHGGGLNGDEMGSQKTSAKDNADSGRAAMSDVRDSPATTKTSPRLQRSKPIRDSLHDMPHQGRSESGLQAQKEDETMQDMWNTVSAKSQQEPQYMQPKMSIKNRQTKRYEAMAWEPEPDAIPRVATGIPNRVNRLKALGNAVVPQVAEFIGSLIVEVENGN